MSERNEIVGALLPGTVVVTTLVVVCVTAVTGEVRSVSSVRLPKRLAAFTLARSSRPTSDERTPYVLPVAPEMSTQLLPLPSHCCHWYENVLAPTHVPLSTVSVAPTTGEPEIVGRALFVGGAAGATTPDPAVLALPVPSAFVAKTFAASRWFTSADVVWYDCAVAPVIATQFWRSPAASQRNHWYVYFVGLPDQVPFDVDSVSPTNGCAAGP